MFETEVVTEVGIEAPPERVWQVLADLEAYSEWNPMIRKASGDLREGQRIDLHFEPEGSRGRDFRPKLLVVEPSRELRWLGNPGVKWMFESQHYFTLEPEAGGTRCVHGMLFYGLVVPLAGKRLAGSTLAPFESMNQALKARAEQSPAAGL
jgi:hypothetical protein